jgi:hypothetical protein
MAKLCSSIPGIILGNSNFNSFCKTVLSELTRTRSPIFGRIKLKIYIDRMDLRVVH